MTLDVSPRLGVLGRQFIDIHGERCDAILQILEAGWKRASDYPEVHPGAGEVEITERLRDGMRAVFGGGSRRVVQKDDRVAGDRVAVEPARFEARRTHGHSDLLQRHPRGVRRTRSTRDRRAQTGHGNRAELCREYVIEGINRFVTGKYAGNHAFGFMAGYLLSGDAASAATRINAYLTGKGRRSERLGLSSFPAAPWARRSRHRRPDSAEPIVLHHAFFGFAPAPS